MTTATTTASTLPPAPSKPPKTALRVCPYCREQFTTVVRGNATRVYCTDACGDKARRLADAQRYAASAASAARRDVQTGDCVTVKPDATLDVWTREYRGRTGRLVAFVAGDCANVLFEGEGEVPVCLERRDLMPAVVADVPAAMAGGKGRVRGE